MSAVTFKNKPNTQWAIFKTVKPFKFEAPAIRKFLFYGMQPKHWWYSLYSKPMGEVSFLDYEYHYWFVAEICFNIRVIKWIFGIAKFVGFAIPSLFTFSATLINAHLL